MNVVVLMASGDEDEWEDVEDAEVDTSGTLAVFSGTEETESGQARSIAAIYAPGMWMKVEYK